MTRKTLERASLTPVSLGVLLGMFTFCAPSAAETAASTERWEVDTRGRPPYERRLVETPVVDVAAIETIPGPPVETITVWQVDRSGKPPFKRRRVEVPVVDAAALQLESDEEEGTVFRGRPPFRRH